MRRFTRHLELKEIEGFLRNLHSCSYSCSCSCLAFCRGVEHEHSKKGFSQPIVYSLALRFAA